VLRTRVIPTLLLKNGGLVKTVRFEKPRYVGDPINAVRIFNEKEADELILLDIHATRSGRGPDFDLLEQIVSEAFMPVAYGGGVSSVGDARRLLKIGIEKVAINSASLEDASLLRQLAREFGAQCVVGSVDVKRTIRGNPEVFSHSGVKVPERDPVRWAQTLVEHGAGEVLLTSVDRDGTMNGYDVELLRRFDGALPVPLLAAGGAGELHTLRSALRACRLSGLSVGSRFIYQGPHRAVLISYLSIGELEDLQGLKPESTR
jgi:cyclase